MRPDKHHHETIKYIGIGTVEYPPVMPNETPFQVAVREATKAIHEDALTHTMEEVVRDHVTGAGLIFRQQHPEIQRRIIRIASVYGLTK